MSRNSERNIYIKQLEELYEQGKKTLMIESKDILSSMSDEELGKLVRETYHKKIEECENHLKYMKSL
jgi:hypothetical protein